MSETPKVKFFIYFFATAAILLYAAVRLITYDSTPVRLSIHSDTGRLDEDVRRFLVQNIGNIREIPSEILERFPIIEHVSVKDNKNGTLEVWIKHKKIIGVWTDGGKFYPLLENGRRLNAPYPDGARIPASFLYFRGHLPENISDITGAVLSDPDLAKKTAYLEYIENRRWNIRLKNGGLILLPEQNVRAAVLQTRLLGVLGKTFDTLDLRDPKRALVK